MSQIADDEPDATIAIDFAFDRSNTEQKPLKFCFDDLVPRLEVVFMSQMNLILLSFCVYNCFLTQLSREETSIWFSILSGLVCYVRPNPRKNRKFF